MRRVRSTIFAVEKHEVLYFMSVCSFSYPACDILSSVVCPAPLHFSTDRINGKILRKNVIHYTMRVLIFSATYVSHISHFKKN